ncbi:MAG: hypothetical protein JO362_15155 [Streptomycetaceae bacterium]|nr:hypothetical protein [Streptomycetaceae bacterium]
MRRKRFTIATLSMAASATMLGMPAATAASVTQTVGQAADKGQVQVVGHHQDDTDTADANDNRSSERKERKHHRRHERHRRVKVVRRHFIRWHHRCGPGWDSGWVRGWDRDKFKERDRFDGREGSRGRDRDFRDNGDRGWGRGWISTCHWRREPVVYRHEAPRVVRIVRVARVTRVARPSTIYTAPSVTSPTTKFTAPIGGVRAGEGGSLANPNLPELALGSALAALGIAGCVGVTRRRSSSR